MRIATAFALFLSVFMGLLAVTQMDSVATAIQVVTTGPLNEFVGLWPYIMIGVVFMVVAGFAISAISRH